MAYITRHSPLSRGPLLNLHRPTSGSGCVLFYPCQDDSQSVTLRDISGNVNNGVITGATWARNGKGFWALEYDGGDDSVALGHPASLAIGTAITIEAWLKPKTIADWDRIVDKEEAGAGYLFCFGGNNNVVWRLEADDVNKRLNTSNNSLSTGIWQHVACVFNGTIMSVLINGVADANTKAYTGAIATSALDCYIGKWSGGAAAYFDGQMGLVRISNRALSAGELLYNQTRHLFGV